MTPSYAAVAGQAVAVAAALLALGYLIADAALRRSDADTLTRWAVAFPALCAWGLLLMLSHIVTRGAVLSNPGLVRVATAALALGLVADKVLRRRHAPAAGRAAGLAAAAVVLLSLAVWGAPLLEIFPLGRPAADTGWHTGWTQQLMNGLATPTAPITGHVPNYYPWLFHGLLAFVARLHPGGTAFDALGPMQLLQVAGIALGLFGLAREVAGRWIHGMATVLTGSLAVGFGALIFAVPSFLERTPQIGGPRLTYNAAFTGLPPALPRDVALTLLIGFAVAAAAGLRRERSGWLVVAGGIVGMLGLTSPEAFFIGGAAAVTLVLVPASIGRGRRAAALLLPAAALSALWFVPVALSYGRLGGFVNTTIIDAPDPSPYEVVLSWGWIIPLAAWGLARWLPRIRREPAAAVPAALLLGAAAVVAASALIPSVLGEGFLVLGRARRYWPILHLALGVYAGLGAADLLQRLVRAGRRPAAALGMAIVGGMLLLAATVPLPLRVSLGLGDSAAHAPLVEDALLGDPRTVVSLVAAAGEGPCVVAAPARLSVPVFTVTGYRLVAYAGRQAARPGNAARIRWTGIYRDIVPETQRQRDTLTLVEGTTSPAGMTETVARYGVDVIVAEPNTAPDAYASLPGSMVRSSEGFAVYRLGSCDD